MKKKGFTLIELLAVIVVLAVIALITTPTIIGVIEKTRKNSLLDSAYGLIESANLYAAQYGMNSVSRFDIENGVQTSTKKLSYKGKVENGTVLINTSGEVTVCVNSKNYSAYKNYKDNKVTLVDNKNCIWNELSNQVYLDGEKTITEYTNQELTELVTNLQGEITLLKDRSYGKTEVDNLVSDLNEKIEQVNTTIIENNNNQAVINNNLQNSVDELNTNLKSINVPDWNKAISIFNGNKVDGQLSYLCPQNGLFLFAGAVKSSGVVIAGYVNGVEFAQREAIPNVSVSWVFETIPVSKGDVIASSDLNENQYVSGYYSKFIPYK